MYVARRGAYAHAAAGAAYGDHGAQANSDNSPRGIAHFRPGSDAHGRTHSDGLADAWRFHR